MERSLTSERLIERPRVPASVA